MIFDAAMQRLLMATLPFMALAAVPPPPCTPNPCLHSAPCSANHRRYSLTPFWCECPPGWAGVRCEVQALVAPAFSSNMVLQANATKAAIYGNANATTPHDTIYVTHSTAGSMTAHSDANGSWSLTLGSMAASLEPVTITVQSKASGAQQTLRNVLVGDVYVCSGQSKFVCWCWCCRCAHCCCADH